MGQFRKKKPFKSEYEKASSSLAESQVKKSPLLVKSKAIKKAKQSDNGKILFTKNSIKNNVTKSKKDKIKKKRDVLLNKFELIKKQRKAEIAKKNREKAAVVGDLKPLKDALPSLNELFKLSRDEIKTGISGIDLNTNKNDKRNRHKKKTTEMMNRYNCFENLLKDSDYKKNPREAIAFHIKYTHDLIKD